MQNSCINEKPQYAGFWVRLCAYVIDMIIIVIPLLLIGLIVSGTTSVFEGTFLGGQVLFQYTLSDIVVYLAQAAYFTACTYTSGTTIGKRLLNLKVISAEQEGKPELMDILFRETIGRFLSSVANIGYICIGLDKEKRGFHDMLSDTRVIYEAKIRVPQPAPAPMAMPVVVKKTEETVQEKVSEVQNELPQAYTFVPEQVTDKSEGELWHQGSAKLEDKPQEEQPVQETNKVTYSWSSFEYVEDNEKKKED